MRLRDLWPPTRLGRMSAVAAGLLLLLLLAGALARALLIYA